MSDNDERFDGPSQVDWDEIAGVPAKWFAVPGAWTLSPDPKRPGWSTDYGCGGYGLPEAVARALAERLNAVAALV